MDFPEPIARNEAILQNMLGAENELLPPMSRIETLLLALLEEWKQMSGGGGVIRLYDIGGYGSPTEIDSAYTIQQLADYFNDFSEGEAAPLPDIVLLRNFSGTIVIYRLCEILSIGSDVAAIRLFANEPAVETAEKTSVVVFGDDGIVSISYVGA